jgi:predicted Fe-Mo cluster-binding NifX family protein
MKIAVSASNAELSSPVDPRFGRCPYFLFVDSETMKFEAVENPNISSTSGAGIQSAQFIAEKGAKAVFTGSCGPNAFQTLQAAGIEVIIGVSGSVQQAVEQYKSGQFQPTAQPNVPPHFGMGMGGGYSMGRGMGRGQGGGMGGGLGRGLGRGMGPRMGYGPSPQTPGMPPSTQPPSQLSPEQEVQHLKQQADLLRQQMEHIMERIEELEKKK